MESFLNIIKKNYTPETSVMHDSVFIQALQKSLCNGASLQYALVPIHKDFDPS
jgi:hypothetical protein